MPAILLALFSGLAASASHIVGRVLIALGIQYVTFTGIEAGFDWVKEQAMTGLGGLPSEVANMVGLFRVDDAIAIIAGAVAARWAIQGLTNGTLTKMVLK